MTTIAYNYKDNEIAVDSRCTGGTVIINDDDTKVHFAGNECFVLAGDVCDIENFVEHYPENVGALEVYGFMIKDLTVYSIGVAEDGELHYCRAMCSEGVGSGGTFALAAMDFGKTAKEAVEYAMTRDSASGGEIHVLHIEKEEEDEPVTVKVKTKKARGKK